LLGSTITVGAVQQAILGPGVFIGAAIGYPAFGKEFLHFMSLWTCLSKQMPVEK
jgi:hypothetical protein